MFIELTDHLRCPEPHAEHYLVLLPGRMEGRSVLTGELGCPACGRVSQLANGVADFGGGVPAEPETELTAEAVAAFLGLTGPGGYVALVGGVGFLAAELGTLLGDIGLVLVNPPEATPMATVAGVLRAGRLPIKSGSMRGVVLGRGLPAQGWIEDGVNAVLPGLRVVSEVGVVPPGVELLARSSACWVGRRNPLRPGSRSTVV